MKKLGLDDNLQKILKKYFDFSWFFLIVVYIYKTESRDSHPPQKSFILVWYNKIFLLCLWNICPTNESSREKEFVGLFVGDIL
jgi:hypothetical protein